MYAWYGEDQDEVGGGSGGVLDRRVPGRGLAVHAPDVQPDPRDEHDRRHDPADERGDLPRREQFRDAEGDEAGPSDSSRRLRAAPCELSTLPS
jgi:hypothetical protein